MGRALSDGGEGGAGVQDEDAAAGRERFEGAAGLVGAVERVWLAGVGGVDEGAPPACAGISGGARRGEEEYGVARRQREACLLDAVDHDRGWEGVHHA